MISGLYTHAHAHLHTELLGITSVAIIEAQVTHNLGQCRMIDRYQLPSPSHPYSLLTTPGFYEIFIPGFYLIFQDGGVSLCCYMGWRQILGLKWYSWPTSWVAEDSWCVLDVLGHISFWKTNYASVYYPSVIKTLPLSEGSVCGSLKYVLLVSSIVYSKPWF